MVLVLNNEEVEQVLTIDACLEALENTFQDFAMGRAVNRPRSHTYTALGGNKYYMFKSMDGAVPRYGIHALRLSSDMTYEPIVNGMRRRDKIPAAPGNRYLGLVLLFSLQTCELLAVIQDGYLQRMRVGATSGVAAKYLARCDARVVGLLGTGWQAGAQLMALCKVRPIERVKVYSPNPQHRLAFAAEMSGLLGISVEPVEGPREVVRGSDIVAAATNSLEAVFDGRWLEEGMHVNSVQGHELDGETLRRADLIIVRSRERPTYWTVGEDLPLEVKQEKRFSSRQRGKVWELGEVVAGRVGRISLSQITLFGGGGMGGSAGLGIQFAAVGARVLELARARGLGREVPGDWFLESVHP